MIHRCLSFTLVLLVGSGCSGDDAPPPPREGGVGEGGVATEGGLGDGARGDGARGDGTTPLGDGTVAPGDGTTPLDDGMVAPGDGPMSMVDGGTGRDGAMSGGDGAAPTDGGPIVVVDGGVVLCGTSPCECNDGLDNDGDGRTDLGDAECTGAFDDDEDSFATGIPGDNRDPDCQDCFFDGDSGSGNDGCRYATSCLTEGNPSSGSGACATCDVTDECVRVCRPAVPNGCDCFGCCQVFLDNGMSVNIQIGGTCSIEMITDTMACPRCIPDDECVNQCGRCELCLGRTADELPPDCFAPPDAGPRDAGPRPDGSMPGMDGSTPDGAAPRDGSAPTDAGREGGIIIIDPPWMCENGEQVCGAGLPPCPGFYLCQLGCCIPTIG